MSAEGARPSPLDAERLEGHTVESLSDYLDRDRTPRDPSIESSPGAQNALAALQRLRALAPGVLAADAERFRLRTEHWIQRILDHIGVQAHAGRDIPFSHDSPAAVLSISEGAVRAIARAVGDTVDGVLIERVRLDGDIESPGAEATVTLEISTFEGVDVARTGTELGRMVRAELARHTELAVTEVVVKVRDTELTDDEDAT